MLSETFGIFWNTCLEIYELDPWKFFSAPGLAWQAVLKKTKVNLDFITDINMLLVVKKGISGGTYHPNYPYVKDDNKYMKDYGKIKNRHKFNIGI